MNISRVGVEGDRDHRVGVRTRRCRRVLHAGQVRSEVQEVDPGCHGCGCTCSGEVHDSVITDAVARQDDCLVACTIDQSVVAAVRERDCRVCNRVCAQNDHVIAGTAVNGVVLLGDACRACSVQVVVCRVRTTGNAQTIVPCVCSAAGCQVGTRRTCLVACRSCEGCCPPQVGQGQVRVAEHILCFVQNGRCIGCCVCVTLVDIDTNVDRSKVARSQRRHNDSVVRTHGCNKQLAQNVIAVDRVDHCCVHVTLVTVVLVTIDQRLDGRACFIPIVTSNRTCCCNSHDTATSCQISKTCTGQSHGYGCATNISQ